MRASSSALCRGKEDWAEKEVHSGSPVVKVSGRTSVVVGLGLGWLVDHMSTGMVSPESPQESPDHRLVAVIVKGTSDHESINEK